jgi:hypothetical protein
MTLDTHPEGLTGWVLLTGIYSFIHSNQANEERLGHGHLHVSVRMSQLADCYTRKQANRHPLLGNEVDKPLDMQKTCFCTSSRIN